jgi:hypothetical protein
VLALVLALVLTFMVVIFLAEELPDAVGTMIRTEME